MLYLTDTSFKALDNLRPAQRHRIMDAVTQYIYKGTVPVNIAPVDYVLFVVILENVKFAQKHGELDDFDVPDKISKPRETEENKEPAAPSSSVEVKEAITPPIAPGSPQAPLRPRIKESGTLYPFLKQLS